MVNEITISALDRLLDPIADCLTPDVAARIANQPVDAEIQAKLDNFADKANQGTLTPEERAEYSDYVEALDIVGVLRAKARKTLKQSQ